MRDKIAKVIYSFFVMIRISIHSLIFPGYKSAEMLFVALGLTIVSVICAIFNLPSLIDWRGALTASLILLVLLLISGKGKD